MLFKKLFKKVDNSRPNITKVSQLINNKSHKQKKYISLMVVPSYSTGKTRTLRVPRALFHGVVIGMLCITAVVLGFYLKSTHHQRTAQNLEVYLEETEARYSEFRAYAQEVQDNLIETATQIYEELNETENRAQRELNRQAETHQNDLDIIIDQIEEIERIIRNFEYERQAIIQGLSQRGDFIPPVAALVAELEASEARLVATAIDQFSTQQNAQVAGIGFMSTNMSTPAFDPTQVAHVKDRLSLVVAELEFQQLLMDNLKSYHDRMDIHLRNHPTRWPVVGEISSGFGFRFRGSGVENHRGVDIRAPHGTPIVAPGGGVVIFAGWRNGFGHTVEIDHGTGITTLYAHASRLNVHVGQHVSRGDIIAFVGSTGDSTGNHLHYEVRIHGSHVNPMGFMQEH